MWASSFPFVYIFSEGFFRMNENKEQASVLKLCDNTSDKPEKESQVKDVKEITMLYICDGYACDNSKKSSFCYRNGGLCCATPHKEHALSQLVPDFPPTVFIPIHNGDIYVEELDKRGILKEMQKGKMLKLIESD